MTIGSRKTRPAPRNPGFGPLMPLLLVLLAAMFLSCSMFRSSSDDPRKEIGGSDDHLRKKIAIALFENHTSYDATRLTETFQQSVTAAIAAECGTARLFDPGSDGYPEFLMQLPRKNDGRIENIVLTRAGRRSGFNAVVTGTILDIGLRAREEGFWLFKDVHHYVQIHVVLEAYDMETGAKLLDANITREIEVDEVEASDARTSKKLPVTAMAEELAEAGEELGEKFCEALEEMPWKGYVLSSAEGGVTVSAGAEAGLLAGEYFTVFDMSRLIRGADGERFFVPGQKTGKIRIRSVGPETAVAEILPGGTAKPGSAIRPADD